MMVIVQDRMNNGSKYETNFIITGSNAADRLLEGQ